MKRIITIVLLLLFAGMCHAQEGSEMAISLGEGNAHVTIRTANPSDLSELRSIIDEPSVKGIYSERLSAVFGDIENLDIYIEGTDFVIEFDAGLATEKDGKWVVERRDFDGTLAPVSALLVSLPDGMKVGATSPASSDSSGGVLMWDDVDFVPHVEYGATNKNRYIIYGLASVIVIGLVLVRRK